MSPKSGCGKSHQIGNEKRACSHAFPGIHLILKLSRYADFPLLIAISERQNTSVLPTIYPELSGTLVIISHIPVSSHN